jgi:hypothetical protein
LFFLSPCLLSLLDIQYIHTVLFSIYGFYMPIVFITLFYTSISIFSAVFSSASRFCAVNGLWYATFFPTPFGRPFLCARMLFLSGLRSRLCSAVFISFGFSLVVGRWNQAK